jgi:hypothetical protein
VVIWLVASLTVPQFRQRAHGANLASSCMELIWLLANFATAVLSVKSLVQILPNWLVNSILNRLVESIVNWLVKSIVNRLVESIVNWLVKSFVNWLV